jgi:hypothetical protein
MRQLIKVLQLTGLILAAGFLYPLCADAATSSGLSIGGIPQTAIHVGQSYYFKAIGYSASGRPLTYSISNHPGWSTFNKTTGALTGSNSNTGTYYNVLISVTDGITTASLPLFNVQIVSSSTNITPPTISGTPATSVAAAGAYGFQPVASSSLGKTLTFMIRNQPSWATFNTSTGKLSGTPTSTGSYANIQIGVSDGKSTAALPAFAITVTSSSSSSGGTSSGGTTSGGTGSTAPTIAGTPPTSVTAGQPYSFTPTTKDPSGKALTFSVTNNPSWASFNTATGQLSGTPTSTNVGTYSNIGISVTDGTQSASLAPFSIAVNSSTSGTGTGSNTGSTTSGAPQVLYTDVISGPNTGGENNAGAYLSIFGKNFGSSGLGSTVKVTLGGVEVASYRYLGPSKGRADIQQITVQVGALGNPTAGAKLPIQVLVNGVASNTNQTFTVNPGRMLFVDNVKGNDSTAVIGDITHPFRHVQTSDLSQGAWGKVQRGDFIVMRGTGTAWTDVGFESYFMRFRDKSGSAPTGASGTGAIVLMGYPTEDTYIRGTLAAGMSSGCISAVNGQSFPGMGQWAVISNLRIDCEGYDGPISQEIEGNDWRVVNNNLAASTAPTSGSSVPRMAGITGNGTGSVWLGNHIHDIQGSSGECHGIYIDGNGSYEIAYNLIENIRSGNGFQIYANGGNGSTVVDNVNFHHNLIHGVSKHGINLADGSRNGIVIYDNVVYAVQYAGVRFNTTNLNGAKIYNNTFYATNASGNNAYGALTNDWNLPSGSLDVQNNIFWPTANIPYTLGSVGLSPFPGTASNNVFYGGNGTAPGNSVISSNPVFVNAGGNDFHLGSGSPAIGTGSTTPAAVVTTDYDLNARSSSSMDVGAYRH